MKQKRNFFPFNLTDRAKEKKHAKKISREIDKELLKEHLEKRKNWITNIIVAGRSQSGKSSLIEHLKLQSFKRDLNDVVDAENYIRSSCFQLLSYFALSHMNAQAQLNLQSGITHGLGFEEYDAVIEVVSKEINVLCQKGNGKLEFQRNLLSNYKRILHPSYSISFKDLLVLKKSQFKHVNFVKDFVSYKLKTGEECQINITNFRKPLSFKSKLSYYFDNTDTIIFCLSLKTFCLSETLDSVGKQLEEDIRYFKSLSGLPCFYDTDFVLTFTHVDVFHDAFSHFSLPDEFINFVNSRDLVKPGPDEFCEFIAFQFKEVFTNKDHRKLFLLKVNYNEVDFNDTVKAVDLALCLIAEISMRCRVCACSGLI